MAGRPPKPTHIKLLEGNPGRRPLNADEPKPRRGVPKCPAYLSDQAKGMWRRLGPELDKLGVLTHIDATALELLCDAYAEWYLAREEVVRVGTTYSTVSENGSVMWRARPEVAIASDAYRRICALLAQFGLTPASRTKVKTDPKQAVDPMDAFLNGKQRGRA